MKTVISMTRTDNNSFDILYSDGTVRHNVGSDGLSDEDRAEMEAQRDEFYAHCPIEG